MSAKLTDSEKAAVSQSVKHARLVQASRKLARMVATVHPTAAQLKRREKLEQSFQKWSEHYLPEVFFDKSGEVHEQAFSKCQYILEHGGRQAESMPRGSGKSAIGKAACIYAPLRGIRKFVVPIGSSIDNSIAYHDFLTQNLQDNALIAEDYPEVCGFFKDLSGSSHKARFQLFKDGKNAGQPTGIQMRPKLIVFPNVLKPDGTPYPSAQSVIMIRSIDGRVRGMSYTLQDGREIRPDFTIPDDIQDEDTAASDVLSAKMESKMTGAVLNLAGHRTKIACYFPCTIQRKGDVSSRFIDRKLHPDFQGTNTPLFISWPEDYEKRNGLWIEYESIWRDDLTETKKTKALNDFYRKNRKPMDAGAKVSWEHRIRHGEISAIQTGMHLLFENGENFFAEFQGEPVVHGVDVYNISPDVVAKRVTDRKPYEKPDWAELVVTGTDINPSRALSSVTIAFRSDRTAAIMWYGKYDMTDKPVTKEMSDTQKDGIIYGALWRHGEELLNHPNRGQRWMIDGGGAQSNAVKRFLTEWNKAHPEMPVTVAYGRSGKTARVSARNETVRKRASDGSWILCRDKDPQYGWTEWVLWNADVWREIMQRAWTCETGAPGGATLPAGRHAEYCQHICREKLKGKVELNGRMVYDFEKAPGLNDYADATNMCYVLSDICGLGSGSVKQETTNKVSFFVSRPSQRAR